jgi:integrase
MMRARFPEHVVKRLAGHSLKSSVTDLYAHLTDEQMQEYAAQLGDLLENGIQKSRQPRLIVHE